MEIAHVQLLIVFAIVFSVTEGVKRCYECTDVPFPRDCSHLTMCGDDEECYLEQVVTSGGLVLYNSGCRSHSRCGSMGKRALDNELVRSDRGMDITICAECCSEEFCNNKGCGQTDVPRDQRGPICFTCDSVLHPSTCNKVTVCAESDICALVLRADYMDYPEDVYQGFCQSEAACSVMSHIETHHQCPPTCCGDDYCNVKCGLGSNFTSSPTTTDSILVPNHLTQTTQPPVTQPTTTHHKHTHATTTPSPCKHGNYYDDVSGLCIRVVPSQTFSQPHAKHDCSIHGERLVVIDTHEKMVFIMDVLLHNIHLHYNLKYAFWIGLTRKDDHSPFVWINGNRLQYSYWGGGDEVAGNQQPDNIPNEHCVMIYPKDHFMWADAYCSTSWGYICEEI